MISGHGRSEYKSEFQKKAKKKECFQLKIVFEFSKLYRRLTSKRKISSKIEKVTKRSSKINIGWLRAEFGGAAFLYSA